jgi:hypothetical protein
MDAWTGTQAGYYDIAIVAGVKKRYTNSTQKTIEGLVSVNVERGIRWQK